ncbi:MAG: hypothetical protein GY938_05260 [Ketobacter sp.]|nr:hypothetical protein [Ketobacter sp.]
MTGWRLGLRVFASHVTERHEREPTAFFACDRTVMTSRLTSQPVTGCGLKNCAGADVDPLASMRAWHLALRSFCKACDGRVQGF